MSERQDRQGARTPADLERRYNFGKSFAEIMGIAQDAQTHAIKAEKIALSIQQQAINIDVVKKLNVSAGTIELKSKGLVIESNGFSLSADKGIKTVRGNIGLWDISEKGISKQVGSSYVKMTAPETENGDVITVAKVNNGVVSATPFLLKANGNVYTKGVIESSNDDYSEVTTISAGRIVTNAGEFGGLKIESDCLQILNEEGRLRLYNNGVPRLEVNQVGYQYGTTVDSYGVTVVKELGHKFYGGWFTLFDGATAYNLWLDHDTNTVRFETINI